MNKLLSKSFLWMFIGLLITFLTGYFVSTNENMLEAIFNSALYIVFAIVELVLVIFISARIHKLSPTAAKISFILYSFVSGLTFSSIFIYFNLSSLMLVFLISALVFGLFGLIGYFTKMDLSGLGTYLLMGLIAIVICAIIGIFINNSTFDLIITIIGLLIFMGFTAYDIQRIKEMSFTGLNEDVIAIYGALQLYLDFINIFLHLLELMGNNDN